MDIRTQIEILMDEYASGERPQKQVADDIMSLINDSFKDGEQAGYFTGHDLGFDVGWEAGYEEGNINGYADHQAETEDKLKGI